MNGAIEPMNVPPPENCLRGGGEMGALMRAFDWSQTSLGLVTSWPQSLRMAVSILLASRFPMQILWGPDYIQFYNDAYRPILGAKHPKGLGQPGRECWQEVWDFAGPLLDQVRATGEATWSDDEQLLIDRNGYVEECYFTFSYTPVRDESGGVAGIFNAVNETTQRVLSERRQRALRSLATHIFEAKTTQEACAIATQSLAPHTADIPFALLYLLDAEGQQAHLSATVGLEPDTAASPRWIDLKQGRDKLTTWPLDQVASTHQAVFIENLEAQFDSLPKEPWGVPPHSALVLPISSPGQEHLVGFFVTGINPRHILDDDYQSFFELIAGHIALAIANARAYEEERKRAVSEAARSAALAELDRAKTAFLSNVSHEFRTPLTLLLGPIEEMLNNTQAPLSPHQREQLETVHRNSLRLLKLVNTLLDFSRIEAGRVHAVYEPIDLATFTSELASVFRSAIENVGVHLIVDCPPLPELVYVDREMWEKIVFNLLSNAFKFTFEGEISVSLRTQGEEVVLEIRDTGTGIPAEELPNLFKRFHRVRGAKARTYEGTGIGLALVQEIAQLHSGTVEVTSVLNQGTTFTVRIPSGSAHLPPEQIGTTCTLTSTTLGSAPFIKEALQWLPEEELQVERLEIESFPPTTQPTNLAGELGSGGAGEQEFLLSITDVRRSWNEPNSQPANLPRILLVDDSSDMRNYVKRLLMSRYEVEAVADGLAALDAMRERTPDLVLTDVMMPGLDGFELLRELRNHPKTREIPVILLSARAGEESRIEGLEAGADDYLIKPFSASELLARINANLNQARMRREAILREQAAQQQVTQILESITDGFASFDKQWRYTYVNQEAARLVHRTREELIGKNVWEEFPEAVGSRFYHEYHRAFTQQVSVEFEEFYPPLNACFQIRIYPSSEGISVYYRDITDAYRQAALRKQVQEALQQSEARYRQIVETSYEGIWTIDSQGRTDFVNQRMAQMLGYTVEQMLGRSVFDFMDEEARFEAEQKFERRKQGLQELHEFRWRRQDGSDLWTLVSTNAILDEQGTFLGAIGMVSDISDAYQQAALRKQAQEQLWDTNQTLNSLIQACPLAITVFGFDDGRVKLWNPAAERIFGWSEQEALGYFLPSVPEDKRDEFLANLETIRQGRELRGIELRRQKKDGSPIDIAVWASAIGDATGEQSCMSILADISDRKRLEEKLRSALMKLNSHVENSPLAVVEWDKDFQVIRWSQQAEELFGWEAFEVLGKHPSEWEFIYAEDAEPTQGIMQRLVDGTEQRNISANRNYTKKGDVVHCEWYNSALFDESGKMASVLSLVLDVTERKQAEAQRNHLLQLEQKARAQAEAANRIKDEFLAVLSHELRSPLNPILGWTTILRTRKCDETTKSRALEIIERNAKLQTQLIEDLLDVSRILRGKLSLNISPVDLKSTIEAALETVRLAAQAKSIHITTVFEPNVGLVSGDGNRLQQVFWNLVSNAIKFTPSGGRVEVKLSVVKEELKVNRLQVEGYDLQSSNPQPSNLQPSNLQLTNLQPSISYAQIQVIDTGKGINPEFLPYVFDYFRQADSTTTRTFGGLGLGLAIVRHLVELHGGTVQAESLGENQGATFSVKLPLMTGQPKTKSDNRQPTDSPQLNGLRILVVDDEADMREFLSFLLEEYGVQVTVVASANEALKVLPQVKPDLLLSDIGMPEVDGYMLIRQIRSMPPEQGGQIPAIALTAYAGETDYKQALAAGFQKHISKPVESDELVAAIAKLITVEVSN
ncbi:MAG: PAS domain S-box protein [Cyanobacteriota bacterium]